MHLAVGQGWTKFCNRLRNMLESFQGTAQHLREFYDFQEYMYLNVLNPTYQNLSLYLLFPIPWNNQHNIRSSSSIMIFKLSSFSESTFALAIALSCLDAVTGLGITARDITHRGAAFIYFNPQQPMILWVFRYLLCTILKVRLNLQTINAIAVHVGNYSTLVMAPSRWVILFQIVALLTEILRLLHSTLRYSDSANVCWSELWFTITLLGFSTGLLREGCHGYFRAEFRRCNGCALSGYFEDLRCLGCSLISTFISRVLSAAIMSVLLTAFSSLQGPSPEVPNPHLAIGHFTSLGLKILWTVRVRDRFWTGIV